MGFDNWLREADAEIEQLKLESQRKLEANEAKRKAERLYFERRNSMQVQVSKCYRVQVLDENGNELVCEYVPCNTKKEAEEIGYAMRDSLLDDLSGGE